MITCLIIIIVSWIISILIQRKKVNNYGKYNINNIIEYVNEDGDTKFGVIARACNYRNSDSSKNKIVYSVVPDSNLSTDINNLIHDEVEISSEKIRKKIEYKRTGYKKYKNLLLFFLSVVPLILYPLESILIFSIVVMIHQINKLRWIRLATMKYKLNEYVVYQSENSNSFTRILERGRIIDYFCLSEIRAAEYLDQQGIIKKQYILYKLENRSFEEAYAYEDEISSKYKQ
jgi:hypothetical protein